MLKCSVLHKLGSTKYYITRRGIILRGEARTWLSLADILGISGARMSEIITGKGEPSLKICREISRKLNIDPAIVLGA